MSLRLSALMRLIPTSDQSLPEFAVRLLRICRVRSSKLPGMAPSYFFS